MEYELKKEDYILLLEKGLKPGWWEEKSHKISYDILDNLFEFSYEVSGSVETLVSRALISLDSSVKLPSKLSNLKKSVSRYISNSSNNRFSVVKSLYCSADPEYFGDKCKELGISNSVLSQIVTTITKSSFSPDNNLYNESNNSEIDNPCGLHNSGFSFSLTNGVVLELFQYRRVNCLTINVFKNLLYILSGVTDYSVSDNAILKHMKGLVDKKEAYVSKKKSVLLSKFLNEIFRFPVPLASKIVDDIFELERNEEHELLKIANEEIESLVDKLNQSYKEIETLTECLRNETSEKVSLAQEGRDLQKELLNLSKLKSKLSLEFDDLVKKLHEIDPNNVNNIKRKMSRRNEKIEKLSKTNKDLQTDLKDALHEKEILEKNNKEIAKTYDHVCTLLDKSLKSKSKICKMKWYYKNISESKSKEMGSLQSSFDSRISELKNQISVLEIEKQELEKHLNNFLQQKVVTFLNGKYTDDVRACFQDLVLMGVSVENVGKVVTSVLENIAKLKVDRLPKATFSRLMFIEARHMSHVHLAEKLMEGYAHTSNTLHTDGTSKFGKHYGTYDIVTEKGEVFLSGIREVAGGDTETQLTVLKSILDEIESSAKNEEHKNISAKIVTSIKNIMSDRHIVQKKFNSVFQDYRTSVLPEVINNWENLSVGHKQKLERVNDFFCGMHFVVGLADQAEAALKAWDRLLFDDKPVGSLANGGYSKGESGTYRLVRTFCKAVQTRGCEKSGRISDFHSYIVNEVGLPSVPLIPFKGNRFNVLFYNAGITFFLHKHAQSFFDGVKDDNNLLKAVFHDFQVPAFIVGCRALGLINKFVTGPLWRLLESGIHILDMSKHYQRVADYFANLSVDASNFLKGNEICFDNIEIHRDQVFGALIEPSIYDESTKQCLELIFGSLSIITRRMLNDHLTGGKYDNVVDSEIRKETVSVSTTNSLAERNFGMLDRLIREKPNANMITYEAIIMGRTNKTSEWRDTLSPEKKEKLMKWARESVSSQLENFKKRRADVQRVKNEKRIGKLEAKKRKEVKMITVKENLCSSISKFGGLWLDENQVDEKLKKLDSDLERREALKVQLQFRQKVLFSLPSVDKKLFFLSEKGKLKSVEVLAENLKKLIIQLRKDKSVFTADQSINKSSILEPNVLMAEKERLKCLLEKETIKLKEKDVQPKTKKRKANVEILDQSLPIISTIDDIIGKRVEHYTFDIDGKEKWFSGVVLCLKPNSNSELVLRYDSDQKLYSCPFSDFNDGLLRVISLTRDFILSKKIQQKFTVESNEETEERIVWWETGVIIDVTENFIATINFFDCDVDSLEEQDFDLIKPYEVLKYPILDDYLHNDLLFC